MRIGLLRLLREVWLGFLIGVVAPLGVWGLGKVHWSSSSHSHRAVAPGPHLRRPVPARSFLERLIPPPGGRLPGVHVDTQIRKVVAKLPLDRKIAQLLLVGFAGRTIKAPFYGTLGRMDLGGVAFDRDNYQSPDQISTLAAGVSNTTSDPRTHTPPFIVAPQEGGDFSAFPNLPPFDNAADLHSTSLAAREARDASKALTQIGFNGVLAPDLDVSASTDQPLAGRAFSDVPSRVSAYATATIGAYRSAHMLSAPGHFPGILLGHAGYQPDDFVVPASLSRAIATRLLRGQLGFKGMAITDDLEAGAITSQTTVPKAAVTAIQAGADMVWISGPESDWLGAYRAILAAVRSKRVPMLRINTAVTRIITAKRELGLKNQKRTIPLGAPGSQ